ncbi:MAG: DUF5666 domain-containing protein, partial [Pseudomonadales bacterium]
MNPSTLHNAQRLFRPALLAAAIAGLSACGGGGGSSSPSAPPPSGGSTSPPVSSTPITTTGSVTGFGSVWVNGIRYDTSNAIVQFKDDGTKAESDLKLGMRVVLVGSRSGDSRSASQIRYDSDLEGPVSSISPNADNPAIGSFTLLGQEVIVDANTVFDDRITDANADGRVDLQDLAPGAAPLIVEVSGFPTADGFLATRIEPGNDAPDAEFEVKGTVADLDVVPGTFKIGNLVVIWEAADLDAESFGSNTLSNTQFVEVKGVLEADGRLSATRIQIEDPFDDNYDDNGTEFEIEGLLQAVDTAADPDTVTINGQTFKVQDASRLVGFVGRKVEIEGTFNADGILILKAGAAGAKIEQENNIRVEDRIQTVESTRFTTRLGVVIEPTGTSRVEDDAAGGDRLTPEQFLGRVRAGDLIQARGYRDSAGTVNWTRIKRDDEEDDTGCALRGPVDNGSITDPTFRILGVTIDTATITQVNGFRGVDGAVTDRSGFFTALTEGTVVDATSSDAAAACTDKLLQAEQVEFELDDDIYGSNPGDNDRDDDEPGDDNGGDDNGGDDNGGDDNGGDDNGGDDNGGDDNG